MTTRICIAAVLILSIYAGTYALSSSGLPTEFATPEKSLAELPLELGDWRGEGEEVDPRLVEAAGSTQFVNRRYRNAAGWPISVHTAVYQAYGDATPPHTPDACYPRNGHIPVSSKRIRLADSGSIAGQAQLSVFARQGETFFVLYWYQLEGSVVVDRGELRRAIWELRGRPAWPPLVKVMLTTSASDAAAAEQQLVSLAQPLAEWMRDFR